MKKGMNKEERRKHVWALGKKLDSWRQMTTEDLFNAAQTVFPALTLDSPIELMSMAVEIGCREQCLKLLVMDHVEKLT